MLQAAIISKPQKPEVAGILRDLIAWLEARHYKYLLDPDSAAYLGAPNPIERVDLTKWAEIAVFQGFKPNEEILATELGLIQKEPYLLSIGFVNWSPRQHVDPQPYLEAGYYTEHQKFIIGAIHVDYRNEVILGRGPD